MLWTIFELWVFLIWDSGLGEECWSLQVSTRTWRPPPPARASWHHGSSLCLAHKEGAWISSPGVGKPRRCPAHSIKPLMASRERGERLLPVAVRNQLFITSCR